MVKWLLLIICAALFLYARRSALLGGEAVPFDLLVMLVLVALLLAPLYQEVEPPGVRIFADRLEKDR